MGNLIQYLRRQPPVDYDDEVTAYHPPQEPQPPPVSTVGRVVRNAAGAVDIYAARITSLRAEIAGLQEQQRQAEAALDSMQAALSAIGSDPALTDEEREMADAAITNGISATLHAIA
jgi:hypothetical protein